MALQSFNTLQFRDRPFFLPFILEQTPYINGGGTAHQAIRPLENLRNKYYAMSASQGNFGMSQSNMIARTNPPVMAATSPVALDASGFGATYRLSDEALRQYSLGTYLHNAGMSYYQTRP
jgi:hypothetical protein